MWRGGAPRVAGSARGQGSDRNCRHRARAGLRVLLPDGAVACARLPLHVWLPLDLWLGVMVLFAALQDPRHTAHGTRRLVHSANRTLPAVYAAGGARIGVAWNLRRCATACNHGECLTP